MLLEQANEKLLFKKTLDTVIINNCLSKDQQILLENSFPNFNIKFSSNKQDSHAFAATHRTLEFKYLLSLIRYNSDNIGVLSSKYDCYLKDVGGNIFHHISNDINNSHVCNPILSVNDSLRNSKKIIALNNYNTVGVTASRIKLKESFQYNEKKKL